MIIKSDYIRDRLSFIESKVKNDTKQKLYDINKTAEDIFMHLLNDVYGWQLVNANDIKPNFPAIDLIDTTNEIVIQVTSSMDDSKVVSTIEKFAKFADDTYKDGAYKQYADYDLKMFYIKEKPNKFSKATQTKIDNQGMSNDDFLGIEDINTKVSANPNIAQKVFKTLCKLLHDKACDSDISPQLTTKLGKSTLIGREKEFQEIDEQLKASKTLLVKGIGGVGKSTIASNYLHRHKDEYDYYGFFEGLESFETELEGAFKLEVEHAQDRLDRVLRELIKLEPESNKLLIIDDVKEIKENQDKLEKILGLEHNGYRVLLTSRFRVKNVKIYPLPTLDPSDAQKLFLDNYKTEELEKVNQITEYLDYHPLFVELVAKTIENEDYSLDDMIEKFELGELTQIEFIDEEEGDEVSFNQNLQKLFEMQKTSLKDEYLLLLKQLAVLPSIDIELSFLEEIFDRKLKSRLNFLVAQGWLIESIDGYKLHQVVKEFLLANYPPSFEDTEVVFDYFNTLISDSANPQTMVSVKDKLIYFQYSVEIIERLKIENETIGDFYNNIGNIYIHLANYNKALVLHKKSLKIRNFFKNDNMKILISYSNLGECYRLLGKMDDAINAYHKSIELSSMEEENLLTYDNLAGIYQSIGDKEKCISLMIKSLFLRIKIFGENHLLVIVSYTNLGGFYLENKDYLNAYNYFIKALSLADEELDEYHLDKANIYMGLAVSLLHMGDYEESYVYLKKTLKIREISYPEEHIELLSVRRTLNFVSEKLNKK